MLNELICKQPLIIFLGAGASAPLDMKTTVQFLNWVKSRPQINYSLLNKIIKNAEPSKEVNKLLDIEAVLDTLERFIEGRHLYQAISGLIQTRTDEYIKLRDHIKDLVIDHYSQINLDKAFTHYKPILEESSVPVIPIFTTNYDLSIEKAFENPKAKFTLIDGFHRKRQLTPKWSADAYSDYRPSKEGEDIILFKLHGSVDWVRTPSGDIQRVEAKKRDPDPLKTVIVYPTRIKKEIHEEPFRTHYDYLLACLTNAKLCVVIGFSFRDQEILEHFREAAGMNNKLEVRILDTNVEIGGYVSNKIKPNRGLIVTKVSDEKPNKNILMATEIINHHFDEDTS